MPKPDWDRIRAHYKHNEMAIHQAGASSWGIDPYAWDHDAGIRMTYIEDWLWSDIRSVGAVLYPQYPVGRRFVDFGNPVARVAIECDGAKFHQDAEADAARQREIEALGWTVYRLTGRECRTDEFSRDDGSGRLLRFSGAAYQRMKQIAEAHGIRMWGQRSRIEQVQEQKAA